MSVLGDKIKAAGQDRERNSCVLELGGEKVTIYATPLTGADLEWVQRKHPDFANNPTIGASVDLIIRKAQTEDGDQAFDVGDKPVLIRETVDFISHIRNGLFPGSDSDMSEDAIEDEVKN